MIVTEDGNKNDPDDAIGGALLYDFSGFGKDGVSMNAGTVSITDINILDSEEGGNIYCRDKDFKKIANDNGVKNFAIPNRHNGGGDGLLNVINMDVTGCSLLVVDFKGSGAVDLTEICVPLAMAGDPMVVGPTGNKTQFWMPLGKFYPVLTTAEGTEVFLRAFGKPGTHSQWIDGVIIKENGVIVADVVVEHDEEERRDDFLDFLKVKVDGKQKHHPGVHASSLGSTKLDFAKHDFPILDKMGDSITITTKGLKLSMFTMPARKFKDEKEAAKYTHIDFKILSIDEPTKCTGFLSDLLFGTDTAEPELKAAWLTKPSPYDESDVIETPESFANETNVIYS